MNLLHLCSSRHVTVYFDSWNNWLYLEWEGALTLEGVQHDCLAIAHCFVAHAYPRVLNNNAHLTSVDWDVAPWLVHHFLPYLKLAGVEQLAWVHGSSLRARSLAQDTLSHLPDQLTIALFADVENAVTWLQHTRPIYVSNCALLPRPATDTKLARVVHAFEKELQATAATPQLAQQPAPSAPAAVS